MSDISAPLVPEAPESSLPELLVNPPWVRFPPGQEPPVLKLKAPKEPTAVAWAPGQREKWLDAPYERNYWERLPEDTDWEEAAGTFSSGRALTELQVAERRPLIVGLIMQAPLHLGEALLADERYRADFGDWRMGYVLMGAVARHGLAAYPAAMHRAGNERVFSGLEPFVDTDVAQLMIKHFGVYPNRDRAADWFRQHGTAAARLTVPDALRKPGPKRQRAEDALRLVAETHGRDALIEAARFYGDEAVEAIAALKVDPLDLYPEPLPEIPEAFDPARLPQILLRGREQALPASATRHLITMLSFCKPYEPYPGVETVIDLFDPDSLAEFAWALYRADDTPRIWASRGVQYALIRMANDAVADRLAPIVARWPKSLVWEYGGSSALSVFSRLGTDSALRHLHRLSQKAEDQKRIRPGAQGALERIAKERGLTSEQLADRLVPDLGLDAEGGMTLDYGPRAFRVGFDEQLKPYVMDGDGKRRKTLPKPGVKDDGELAPAAHRRFAGLKKEVRTIAAEQIKRLEAAMVAGRAWTPEEFRSIFVDHPLLWHIARRLVWSAEADGTVTHFRVAEDRTLADVEDEAYALPAGARVTLPHPLRLDGAVDAWSRVLADYEILQPFPQLGRTIHTLTDEERKEARLARFEGRTVHFGKILNLTGRGWELGEKETGGFRRQASLKLAEDRHLVIHIEPGIRVIGPEEFPDQEIRTVALDKRSYGIGDAPFGDLDPTLASEVLAELTRLTEGSTT
ncbi:hypothetical protein GCM10023085_55070 [Actinomadura viridis]|uniref:DUF4132 domain-containing protein n=1 Tax=Actinomadura viridis TaxID=58110 RepID=A0A931GKJ4_9ACTN|nr:DUF4132 domain-containing protein [Actinomadura viridis]MBG6086466.1 hypothetical protein [Actinomadura viridis]